MSGTGATIAQGGLKIDTALGNLLLVGRTLRNTGTAIVNGNSFIDVGSGAVIDNQSGATFDFQSDAGIRTSVIHGNATFSNEGVVLKSVGVGITTIAAAFNDNGTLDVKSGTIDLDGGGTSSAGKFIAETGTSITFSSFLHSSNYTMDASSTISGAGTIVAQFPDPNHEVNTDPNSNSIIEIGANQGPALDHDVQRSFLDTWFKSGGLGGVYGAPIDEARPGTGNVISQRFNGGLMYNCPNTGLLTVPYDLPPAALAQFDSAYGPVRHALLSQFFYNGFVAQRVSSGGIAFSDQTKDMGHTLMSFAQEAAILKNAGFDPTPAENVVKIILNAFDQLSTDAVSALYGPQSVEPGLFVRDYVADVGEGDPLRQGIPIHEYPVGTIYSDFQDAGGPSANGNSTNGNAVMSADQITFMMDGWWAVAHYATDPADVAKAKSQASAVMDYMIKHRYQIRSVGNASVTPSRGDARLPAAFLSHLADEVTGGDSFSRLDNTISIGTINKSTLVNGIVNIVDGILDVATAGLNEGYKALFHDDPGRDVADALTARLPSEIPVELPVSVENGILLAILKINPFYITTALSEKTL
jgi:hypothetical protein